MNLPAILDMFHKLEQLRQHERWTRPQLATHQALSLRRLREHVYAHSPFYRKFHQGLMDRPLAELPVLTKATMMEHFDDLVTHRDIRREDVRAFAAEPNAGRRYLGRYWVNASSGSTGRPGLFLFDQAEWATVLASFARSHEWAGVKVNLTHRMRMASVASVSPLHMSAQVGATLKSWWMPALRLSAAEPLPDIVRRLNGWQPEMLVTYASMARILADEQMAGRLRIGPHRVYTSSEVLTDETRRRIEMAWGRPPFNQYAATETGGLAAECGGHHGLHIHEDLAIIEVVDEHNRPVPPGVYGDKLLVTVLFNCTQPLIRYEVRDSVRLAVSPGTCRLPFAVVDGIQGRTEEMLQFSASGGGSVTVHPLMFHGILDSLPVDGWQVVQDADGLTILLSGLASERVNDVTLATAVAQALALQGASSGKVTIRRVSAIPKTAAGKSPLISVRRPDSG